MRIWDPHCHVNSKANVAGQIEQMIEIGSRVGIERFGVILVVDSGTSPRNTAVLEALEQFKDRVFGLCWLMPTESVETAMDLTRQWVENGPMLGIKLGGYSGVCSRPEFDPLFVLAGEIRALIYLHTWIKVGGEPRRPGGANLPHESTPMDAAILAGRHPEIRFICGHNGGDWEMGTRAIRNSPNLWCEIAGGYPSQGQVEYAVQQLGAERVIYGSDVTGRSFSTQLGKVWGARISHQQRELIFRKNLHELLRPILKIKGLDWD